MIGKQSSCDSLRLDGFFLESKEVGFDLKR